MRMIMNGDGVWRAAAWIVLGTLMLPGTAGAQTFSDQTTRLAPTLANSPAAWGDYDNDGWVDLLVGHRIWRNNAGTGFSVAHLLGAPGGYGILGDYGIWGDYDNDGFLDVFRWSNGAASLHRNLGGTGFEQVAFPILPMLDSNAAAWGDFDGDGFADLYVGGYEDSHRHGEPDVILTNRGQGAYFEQTWIEVNPRGAENIKQGRGITVCDFDQDSDLDVFVSNYRDEENQLWRNGGTGIFADAAEELGLNELPIGVGIDGATIGSAWGDMDNDGYFDLFEGNFSHSSYRKPATFYRNTGPAVAFHFEDMSQFAGLAWQESYATPALGDYDNDGDLDLYFTTAPTYPADHCVLYRNDGNWRFTDVTDLEGLSGLRETYQAAWADFDRDGDLDLVTKGKIFVNAGNPNRWMKVKLVGENGVGDVIGSQVRITDPYGNWTGLTRQVEAGTGEANQNDMTLHFGLGPGLSGPVSLQVIWPDGTQSVIWEEFIMLGEIIIQKGLPWG